MEVFIFWNKTGFKELFLQRWDFNKQTLRIHLYMMQLLNLFLNDLAK